MTLDNAYKSIIYKNEDLIKENNFYQFYKDSLHYGYNLGVFTDFFMKECGINLFEYLDTLPEFMFSGSTQEFISISGKFTEIPGNFLFDSEIKEIHLSDKIDKLSHSSFESAYKLEKIILPDNIEEIPDYCFAVCASIKNISLPKNLKYIGNAVFSSCVSLEKIKIPENTIFIGHDCFRECTNLKEIIFPSSLKNFLCGPFYSVNENVQITYPPHGTHSLSWYKENDIFK